MPGEGPAVPFVAARAVGARAARALWLLLWASLAYFALLPANRAPQALPGLFSGMTRGEPAWLHARPCSAAQLAHQGLTVSVVLAALLVLIAVGVYLPRSAARVALALAAVLAATIWVAGQALGGMLTGSGTDPGSGPLLILLVFAYWPVRTGRARSDEADSQTAAHQSADRLPGGTRMTGPSWLADVLAVTDRDRRVLRHPAGHRPSARRPDERDVNLVHTVMGVAMAGMLVRWPNPLPDGVLGGAVRGSTGPGSAGGPGAAAGLAPTSPALASHRTGTHVPHLVMCGAMVYMLLAAGAGDFGAGRRDDRAGGHRALPAARPGPRGVHGGLRDVAGRPAARPGPVAPAAGPGPAGPTRRPSPRPPCHPRAEPPQPAPPGRRRPAGPGHPQVRQRQPGRPRTVLSPRLAACCQIAMAVTMGYMLILML